MRWSCCSVVRLGVRLHMFRTLRSMPLPANHSCNQLQTRFYWSKRGPRKPPTKPMSFDFSGDLTMSVGKVDYSQPKLGFENLPELESADEEIKRIFSLEFSSKAEVVEKVLEDITKKVQEHPLDIQSLEITIARMTVKIRNNIQHCLRFRNDKYTKTKLIKAINHRRKFLKMLQERDLDRFNWLCTELRLRLVPHKTPEDRILSRREVREKAARDATVAIVRQKTEELQRRLAIELEEFEKYREAELADIERSLKELGIDEMASLEQTLSALGLEEMIPRHEEMLTWEERMKQKKVEALMQEKKKIDAEILREYGFIVPKTLES